MSLYIPVCFIIRVLDIKARLNVNTATEIYCELYEVNVLYSKYLAPYSLFITASFGRGFS